MNKTSKIVYFFIAVIFFIALDLYFSNLLLDLVKQIPNNPVIDIVFIQNTGAAFSILEDSTLFLIVFGIVAILTIILYGIKNIENFSTFASLWASMLVAGIFCNLYERICFGYVRDFFKLNFIDFPVFNISDIFINIGVLALIIIIIKNKYIKK